MKEAAIELACEVYRLAVARIVNYQCEQTARGEDAQLVRLFGPSRAQINAIQAALVAARDRGITEAAAVAGMSVAKVMTLRSSSAS